jgi:hypothetical protein
MGEIGKRFFVDGIPAADDLVDAIHGFRHPSQRRPPSPIKTETNWLVHPFY